MPSAADKLRVWYERLVSSRAATKAADARIITTLVLFGITLGIGLLLAMKPPSAPSQIAAIEPMGDRDAASRTDSPLGSIKIVDAGPRREIPCAEQTWPYIDRRCLTIAEPKPQAETTGAGSADVTPVTAALAAPKSPSEARELRAREQTARELAARELAAREQTAREQIARQQAAREQTAREQMAREQAAREQAAREQAAREQTAREQMAHQQAARELAAREQTAREQTAREQMAREQMAREQTARQQMARVTTERQEAESPRPPAPMSQPHPQTEAASQPSAPAPAIVSVKPEPAPRPAVRHDAQPAPAATPTSTAAPAPVAQQPAKRVLKLTEKVGPAVALAVAPKRVQRPAAPKLIDTKPHIVSRWTEKIYDLGDGRTRRVIVVRQGSGPSGYGGVRRVSAYAAEDDRD